MLYAAVRPIATLGIRVFYRKIYLTNADRIPRGKPVILAANHPTGFMEPCVLACHLDRPLYFLVRGDFFKKRIYNLLLRSLHMVPVYRAKDRGYAYVKNNYETFEFCYTALRQNKTLMILAEGSAEHEKRLRPLQKGTARIAFGTLEKYPELEDVYVVPVGVNYTYADQPRSEIMIDFGEPLRVSEYFAAYRENPNQTAQEFTEALRERMLSRIVHINEQADDELTEYLLQLWRSERVIEIFPIVSRETWRLQGEKQIADWVNALPPTEKSALLNKTRAYFQQLQHLSIADRALISSAKHIASKFIALAIALPLFAIGAIFNFLPVWVGKSITDRRVRRVEFYAPVYWATAMGAYLIWWLLWLAGLLIFMPPVAWLWLLLMPALGYFAVLYTEYWKNTQQQRRAAQLDAAQREHLLAQRQELKASTSTLF